MMQDKDTKEFKRTRIMYMGEATLEYLIAILVQSTFLARITKELGCSDSLTGIISSFISLGCLFQLISIFFRRKTVKKFVLGLSIANQILFMLLYVIPVTPLPKTFKIVVFVVFIFTAYFLYNIAHPKKISWLMSSVDDRQRGRFTANKEIISLVAGIAFSYGMGAVIDNFKAKDQLNTAFLLCAVVIFVLTVLHSLSMVFSIEPEIEYTERSANVFKSMISMFKEKKVLQIAVLFVLWYIAGHGAAAFFGSYQNNELQFDQRFAVILSAIGSVARIIFSRPCGRYADKHSFASLVRWCLLAAAIAYGTLMFATPLHLFDMNVFGWNISISVGSIAFFFYFIIHGISQAGINSALINLVFDYVPHEKRADSLAFCQALAGITGFVSTLLISPLVANIQNNGNTLFGLNVYAQQVTAGICCFFCVVAIIYVSFAFLKGADNRE